MYGSRNEAILAGMKEEMATAVELFKVCRKTVYCFAV